MVEIFLSKLLAIELKNLNIFNISDGNTSEISHLGVFWHIHTLQFIINSFLLNEENASLESQFFDQKNSRETLMTIQFSEGVPLLPCGWPSLGDTVHFGMSGYLNRWGCSNLVFLQVKSVCCE